jgi:hypothetical protein
VDIEAAAEKLPSLKPAGDRPESAVMTGTDPTPVLRWTATENATGPEDDDPNPVGGTQVASREDQSIPPKHAKSLALAGTTAGPAAA